MLPVIKTQVYEHRTVVKVVTINKNVTADVVCFSTVFVSFITYINLRTLFDVKIFSVVQ
jgi:hypothetical protein